MYYVVILKFLVNVICAILKYKYFYANHFHISGFLGIFFLSIFRNFLFGLFHLEYLADFLVAWLIFGCLEVTRKKYIFWCIMQVFLFSRTILMTSIFLDFNAESILIWFLMLSVSFGGILTKWKCFCIFVVRFMVVCKNIIFNAEYDY